MEPADAAVAILHKRGAEESVLLIRRSEREDDPWSGHWSFPGGRRDPSDANALATALRELREECGIQLDEMRLERALDVVPASRRAGRGLRVAPFLFAVDREFETTLDPREAAASAWVLVSKLRDPVSHRIGHIPGLPVEVLFPYIQMDGMPLWGFTYRLITEWLELIPRRRSSRGAAFEMARRILDFVQSCGAVLQRDWTDETGAQTAVVRGVVAVTQLIDYLTRPNSGIPFVNSVEVGATRVQILGLALEKYVIAVEP